MVDTVTADARYFLGSTFQQWSEPWLRLGIWLSLWDEEGQCLDQSQPDSPFWEAVFRHSNRPRRRLAEVARNITDRNRTTVELDPDGVIIVTAIPVHCRQRITGSMLVCGLTPVADDPEAFARFCGRHQLDGQLLQRFAADVPRYRPEYLESYADILTRQVEAFSVEATGQYDINGLSAHLADAYEQLNLLYQATADMTVSKRPASHFETMCNRLVQATVVENLATVLDSAQDPSADATIVTAGPNPPAADDVRRLYQQARLIRRNAGSALVINNVAEHPHFAWARDWLRQLAFFELSVGKQVFGGILAINHRDGEDFGSEEVLFINAMAQRSSASLENVRLYDDLEQLFMGMLHALVSSIDAKDPYTCGHSQRVAWLSRHIARLAGISESESQRVYLSGLLHDIGKIGVSESVLRKTGRLTAGEYEEMKRHPIIGASILQNVRQVDDLVPGVLHHHNRLDGKGYPHGLSGDDIPLLGRIVGLADGFDAMTTNRTYRKAQHVQVAVAEIRRCAGTQFDPALADLFLAENVQDINRKMALSGRTSPDPDHDE